MVYGKRIFVISMLVLSMVFISFPGWLSGEESGKTWRDPITDMAFVWIPGGCYPMGSPLGERGRDDDAETVHDVCVEGLWMGRYEVTNVQYRMFKTSHNSGTWAGQSLNDDHQPAVQVSWEDANAFSRWLARQNGDRSVFRLPTEAEWEYASRGGIRASRYWGDAIADACDYANVHDRSSQRVNNFDWVAHDCDDGQGVTSPAGSYKPNGFALYDMLGNVWEWCVDIYRIDAHHRYKPDDVTDQDGEQFRVSRGGSWVNRPADVRSARRGFNMPDDRHIALGFRLVRMPAEGGQPPAPVEARKKYAIQVSAHRDPKGADAAVAALIKKGYHAYRTIGKVPGKGIWYRVRVGNFDNKTEAKSILTRLKQDKYPTLWVKQNLRQPGSG